jgi:hypothetical protein
MDIERRIRVRDICNRISRYRLDEVRDLLHHLGDPNVDKMGGINVYHLLADRYLNGNGNEDIDHDYIMSKKSAGDSLREIYSSLSLYIQNTFE